MPRAFAQGQPHARDQRGEGRRDPRGGGGLSQLRGRHQEALCQLEEAAPQRAGGRRRQDHLHPHLEQNINYFPQLPALQILVRHLGLCFLLLEYVIL